MPDSNVDMAKLKKRALFAVWAMYLPYALLCQLPWLSIFLWHGWPRVPMSRMEPIVFLWCAISTAVVSNTPDYVSIFLYCKMARHFRSQDSLELGEQQPNDNMSSNSVVDFGGIWVGGDMGSLDVMFNNFVGESPEGSPPQQLPPPAINSPNHDSNSNPHHGAEAVMKVLKWHMCLCLLDVFFAILTPLTCTPVGKVTYHFNILVSCVWVPILLMKNNFRQLDNLGKSLLDKLCSE